MTRTQEFMTTEYPVSGKTLGSGIDARCHDFSPRRVVLEMRYNDITRNDANQSKLIQSLAVHRAMLEVYDVPFIFGLRIDNGGVACLLLKRLRVLRDLEWKYAAFLLSRPISHIDAVIRGNGKSILAEVAGTSEAYFEIWDTGQRNAALFRGGVLTFDGSNNCLRKADVDRNTLEIILSLYRYDGIAVRRDDE